MLFEKQTYVQRRAVLKKQVGSGIILLTGKYAFMRLVLRRFRGNGYNLKHVVVIGTGKLAKQYRDDIAKEAELGFHIIGFVGNQNLLNEEDHWLGSFKELDSILSSPDISEVVIALEPEEYNRLWTIIPACEQNGVKYSVIPFYNNIIPYYGTIINNNILTYFTIISYNGFSYKFNRFIN